MTGIRVWGNRDGTAFGNFMIVFSIVVLGVALLAPSLQLRAFEVTLDRAAADVEIVRAAASDYFAANQDWPDPSRPGEMSPQLAGAVPAGFVPAAEEYRIKWDRWELVRQPVVVPIQEPAVLDDDDVSPIDSLPPIPPATIHAIGGVTVYSGNRGILEGLLERYGPAASFVRDTMWTLVLPTRSAARPGS